MQHGANKVLKLSTRSTQRQNTAMCCCSPNFENEEEKRKERI